MCLNKHSWYSIQPKFSNGEYAVRLVELIFCDAIYSNKFGDIGAETFPAQVLMSGHDPGKWFTTGCKKPVYGEGNPEENTTRGRKRLQEQNLISQFTHGMIL